MAEVVRVIHAIRMARKLPMNKPRKLSFGKFRKLFKLQPVKVSL
jgi:hypothetical protein